MFALAFSVAQPSPEQQQRVDEAVAPLKRATELSPRSADAYVELANKFETFKFLRAASGAWETAVALRPQDPELYRRLGVVYKRAAPPGHAERAYRTSIALRPEHAETHFNLGNAVAVRGVAGAEGACEERPFIPRASRGRSVHSEHNLGAVIGLSQ